MKLLQRFLTNLHLDFKEKNGRYLKKQCKDGFRMIKIEIY